MTNKVELSDFNIGNEALLDPGDNRHAQFASILFYGLPSAVIVGVILGVAAFAVSLDIGFSAIVALPGLFVGFALSIYSVKAPSNVVPMFLGEAFDENWVAPSGWQCYWLRPFAKLDRSQVGIGERQVEEFEIPDVETSEGTRFKVSIAVRRYYVRWPLPYIRSLIGGGDPKQALIELLTATVRKYIRLFSDEQVLAIENMNLELANVLSGEKDKIALPANGRKKRPFQFSGGEEEKMVWKRLQKLGFHIPNGGVDVTNINEPDDVADAKSEQKQSEVREAAIAKRVKARTKLQEDNPGVTVNAVAEEVLADAGVAKLYVVRGGPGEKPGDFTTAAAVTAAAKAEAEAKVKTGKD